MKNVLFAAALLAAGAARAESLDGALRDALANNRRVANQQLEAAKAHDRFVAIRTNRLPRLNLDVLTNENLTRLSFNFAQGFFGVYPGIGPIPAQDTKLTIARTLDTFALFRVTQPITQLRQVAIGARMAEEQEAIERERLRGERVRLAGDVARLYHAMQQTREAIAASDAAIATLQEIEKIAQRHLEQQTILKADVLDVNARLAAARAVRTTATNAYATQREQLSFLLGRPFTEPDAMEPPPAGDVEAAPNRADVAEVRLRVKQAEDDVRLQRAKQLPDVSLVGVYVAPSTAGVLPRNIAAATLLVSYEPFTWGRRGAEIAEKQKSLEQARNALHDAEEGAAVEIAERRRKIGEARASIDARRAEQETADERLRVVRERFGADAALLKDVLERQAALADANRKLSEATESYWIARADLDRALGGVLQ
jgi:outer membrane protein TolC